MKLIKLSDIHYVVVDDSEIKVGDWVLDVYDNSIKLISNTVILPLDKDYWKKITYSTQPIEEFNWMGNSEKGYDTIKPIPLSEVKTLIGVVDVEKKAEQYSNIKTFDDGNTLYSVPYKTAFITGYNQALDDNKGKKYTEEDLITFGIRVTSEAFSIIDGKGYVDMKKFDKILQCIQPKTEWEVEFVDGKLKLKQ